MAYSAPTSKSTGDLITAAIWNQDVVDNQNAAFPGGAGAFPTWTPVVTQSNTPTSTVNRARYFKIGRLVIAYFNITFTSAGTAANAIALAGFPTAVASTAVQGSFRYFDAGNTNRAGHIRGSTASVAVFNYDGFGNEMGNGDFVIANGDIIEGTLIYEAAS